MVSRPHPYLGSSTQLEDSSAEAPASWQSNAVTVCSPPFFSTATVHVFAPPSGTTSSSEACQDQETSTVTLSLIHI